jgi:hypothetical protein
MDIVNELKIIDSNQNNKKELLRNLTDDFDKKLHIFKVMEFAYAIDNLLADKNNKKYISSIRINNNQYPNRPLMITIIDSQRNDVLKKSINLMNEIKELSPLIENIRDSKVEYTKCSMPLSQSINIEFKKGAGDEILKNLLSDELFTILQYSKMQLELDNGKEDTSKKKLKM